MTCQNQKLLFSHHYSQPITSRPTQTPFRWAPPTDDPSLLLLHGLFPRSVLQELSVHLICRQLHVPDHRAANETVFHRQLEWNENRTLRDGDANYHHFESGQTAQSDAKFKPEGSPFMTLTIKGIVVSDLVRLHFTSHYMTHSFFLKKKRTKNIKPSPTDWLRQVFYGSNDWRILFWYGLLWNEHNSESG